MGRFAEAWEAFWLAPDRTLRVAWFSRALAVAWLLTGASFWPHAAEWLGPDGFQPSPGVISRAGLDAVPPLPGWLLVPAGVAYFAAFGLLLLGRWRAVAATLSLAVLFYITFAEPLAIASSNRVCIGALAVLAVAAWRARLWPGPQPCWPLRVLQLTLLVFYFNTGWYKVVHGEWLDNPWALWTILAAGYRTQAAAWALAWLPLWVFSIMQFYTVAFELMAPLLFGVRAFRPLAFALGLPLHVGIALMMRDLGYFSLTVYAFYFLFVSPETLERWERLLPSALRQKAP